MLETWFSLQNFVSKAEAPLRSFLSIFRLVVYFNFLSPFFSIEPTVRSGTREKKNRGTQQTWQGTGPWSTGAVAFILFNFILSRVWCSLALIMIDATRRISNSLESIFNSFLFLTLLVLPFYTRNSIWNVLRHLRLRVLWEDSIASHLNCFLRSLNSYLFSVNLDR